MSIPLFLAVTPAEFAHIPQLPSPLAWMSVRLSPMGPGLSNIPSQLPPGSLIILDDKTPWDGHNIELICKEITTVLMNTRAYGLLLDFERAPTPATSLLAKALSQCCKEIGIPLGAPQGFTEDDYTAVFTPPLPCDTSLRDATLPQRRYWLDVSPTAFALRITQDSAIGIPLSYPPDHLPASSNAHWDKSLCCNYSSQADGKGLVVTLSRDPDATKALLDQLESSQIQLAVGVWREYTLLHHAR